MKKQINNWQKDFRIYLQLKYNGILIRRKWENADIKDIFDCLNEQILPETRTETKEEVLSEIKNAIIKNKEGILLTSGDDNFIVLDSFLKFLEVLKKKLK